MLLWKVLDSSKRRSLGSWTPVQVSLMQAAYHCAPAALSLLTKREPLACVLRSYKNARGLSPHAGESIWGEGEPLLCVQRRDSIRSKLPRWRARQDTDSRLPLDKVPGSHHMYHSHSSVLSLDAGPRHFNCHLQDETNYTTQVLLLQTTLAVRWILSDSQTQVLGLRDCLHQCQGFWLPAKCFGSAWTQGTESILGSRRVTARDNPASLVKSPGTVTQQKRRAGSKTCYAKRS